VARRALIRRTAEVICGLSIRGVAESGIPVELTPKVN
jgi:hypothetical protein